MWAVELISLVWVGGVTKKTKGSKCLEMCISETV